jgi:hypothetical protein
MIAKNRKEWEGQLVREAAYFTCSTPKLGPRPRGHRLAWDVTEHKTLAEALAKANTFARALIYAVNSRGDSAPISRQDAVNYIKEIQS